MKTREEINKYHNEWYLKNKDKVKKYYKNWLENGGIEKNREYHKIWYKKNQEKERERQKEYYKIWYSKPENKERRKIQARKYNQENKNKRQCRGKTRYAIKLGKLIPKPCEKCNNKKSEPHHEDYTKHLEVKWLCKKCHQLTHRTINQSINY